MTPIRMLALFVTTTTGLRWWWNFARPLSPDEAYLALCGFIPSLAYFDGPGGTPWLVALGISMAGPGGFGATFFWPVLAALASVFAYLLVAALAGRREALAVVVLLNLLPIFNQASLHASCAMPLTATALGALLFAWHALEKNSAGYWAASGLCAACGFLFSYNAWFIFPVVTLVLLASRRWRRKIATPGFWLAWAPIVAVAALLLNWNAQHDWIHFIGGTWRTALSLEFGNIVPTLVSAAKAVTPFAFVALTTAVVVAVPQIRISPKIKFLSLPALAGLIAALYTGLHGNPAQTPGLMAAAFSLPLLAWLPERIAGISLRPAMILVFVGTAVWCAATLPRPDSAGCVDAGVGRDIEQIRTEQTAPGEPPPFLVAEDAPLASALALAIPVATAAVPGHPPVYTVESAAARSQFDLWPRYDQVVQTGSPATTSDPDPFTEQDGANPFVGRSALYITTQSRQDLPQAITAAFAAVAPLSELNSADGRVLHVYLCLDYQMMPL